MNINEFLRQTKAQIVPLVHKQIRADKPAEHYRMVFEYPRREGKYFRPALVLLGNLLLNGDPRKAKLLAAAVQLSEDWLLIHDDIEDHSFERRSTPEEFRPTLHQIYGKDLAINAGDSLHLLMWKTVGEAIKELGDTGWLIYEKINEVLLKTTEGQYIELSWIRNNYFPTEKEYLDMAYNKACAYTIIGPLQIGMMSAGCCSQATISSIEKWGKPFGLAFQIWDDVMNLIVPSEKQGKEIGGDILEGKRTLLLIHLLNNCTLIEKDYVSTIYRKPRKEKTSQDKDYVINLMKKYKSIENTAAKAVELTNRAQEIFLTHSKGLNAEAQEIVISMMSSVVNRTR